MPGPNGTIGHADITIGASRIMLADEYSDMRRLPSTETAVADLDLTDPTATK
jgi:uncharacterized glyoxalase superfamily protein PhnB